MMNESCEEIDWNSNSSCSFKEERWPPLGGNSDSESMTESKEHQPTHPSLDAGVTDLQEENERMTNSLLSLTSHFAQIQFRLKQIIAGPSDHINDKLKDLEKFSEQGIPDVKSYIVSDINLQSDQERDDEYRKVLNEKQKEMITELRDQLCNLESYAYESGIADELPTNTKLHKQDVLIHEIRERLQMRGLENIAGLSTEQLKHCVEEAVAQIVNPGKVKEKQLEQLRTQVTDLERFVDFLQEEVNKTNALNESQTNTLSSGTRMLPDLMDPNLLSAKSSHIKQQNTGSSIQGTDEETTGTRLKRMILVLHMYVLSELGCASKQRDTTNNMKENTSQPHYGDLLADTQMKIDHLIKLTDKIKQEQEDSSVFTECDYLSDEESYTSESKELTFYVRKEFTVALKYLLEHGLMSRSSSRALVSFGFCTPRNSVLVSHKPGHIWSIILAYYNLKNGKEYNQKTTVRLANSFGEEAVAGQISTVKQTLLSGIGHIIETHTPFQRSEDSMFKAFICMGLNQKKLVPWLRQIVHTSAIVDDFFQPWSYVAKTGCEDIFCAMNKLKLYDFKLSVDMAVKQFSNMKDAF